MSYDQRKKIMYSINRLIEYCLSLKSMSSYCVSNEKSWVGEKKREKKRVLWCESTKLGRHQRWYAIRQRPR